MTFIGGDRVIVVRDNDGLPQVLVNSCRHRGNAVCRAEEGHATSFMCTYHGWTYDLNGALVGVPGFKEVYHEELDRENWGLIKAGKVDTYGGFIFATMDPEAPSLMDFLGDVGKLTIDYFNVPTADQYVAGVQKWAVPCNWKFAADNIWDWYHVTVTHNSSGMSGASPHGYVQRYAPNRKFQPELVSLGKYGHAIGGAARGSDTALALPLPEYELLGPVGKRMGGFGGIFPNLWVATDGLVLRVPMGPLRTEMWRMLFLPRNGDPDEKRMRQMLTSRIQGPGGHFEVDDAENWGLSTTGTTGTTIRRHPLNYAMSLGHGKVTQEEGGPPYIYSENWTEHGQRWFYQNWAAWMSAESWREIEQDHVPVPLKTF
jgi:nitrite reductase/ring-hydroxylating ferredoxin subunit